MSKLTHLTGPLHKTFTGKDIWVKAIVAYPGSRISDVYVLDHQGKLSTKITQVRNEDIVIEIKDDNNDPIS